MDAGFDPPDAIFPHGYIQLVNHLHRPLKDVRLQHEVTSIAVVKDVVQVGRQTTRATASLCLL